MESDVTELLCDCGKPATHLLLLMNLRMYQPGCADHPRRAVNTVESVVGVQTVLYYEGK